MLEVQISVKAENILKRYRDLGGIDKHRFKMDAALMNWSHLDNLRDVNAKTECLILT